MDIELKKTKDLTPYSKNARKHSDEQISKIVNSITEFGWTNPILIDGDNGIIAGHGRLMAAIRLKMEEVPVIELKNLSDEQKKAYILADNRIALDADWDYDLVKTELDDLSDLDFDIDLIGFSAEELSDPFDDDEELKETKEKIREKNNVHVLISFDSNLSIDVNNALSELTKMSGVEVEFSGN